MNGIKFDIMIHPFLAPGIIFNLASVVFFKKTGTAMINSFSRPSHFFSLFLSILVFLSVSVNAETYFIATDGNDSNEGSIENPFGTFSHAIEVGLTGILDTGNPSAENKITLNTSPNPFSNNTVISFKLDYSGVADLNIYNLYGEEICCLSSAWFAAGSHSIMWDCTDGEGKKVKEGMYLIALTTKRAQQTVKVIKIR